MLKTVLLFPEIIRFWSYCLVAIDGRNVLPLLPPSETSPFAPLLFDVPLVMPCGASGVLTFENSKLHAPSTTSQR